MSLKGDGAKMFAMMLFVFCFFISGYEHSVANMCTFAIALVLNHPGTISLEGVLHNLIPVTIGNLIGGVADGFYVLFCEQTVSGCQGIPGRIKLRRFMHNL